MSLAGVGLTVLEEEVYRALLRGEMGAVDGESDAVRAAIARLAELELIRLDGDGRTVVVEPEIGIARLIRRRMLEANAGLRRICGALETLHALSFEGRRSGSHDDGSHDDIERIEDTDEVSERIWSMSLNAGEVLVTHPQQRRVPVEMSPCLDQRLGERGRWRTIIPREYLKDPEVAEYCTHLHRGGDRHRVTDEAVQQMVILNRMVAFVPIEPNSCRSGALVIRQPGAVAPLVDLFERVWEHATDLEPEASPELTARERQILRLLTTVAKDEIAAREMDMSLRSYRRHVADLIARLGAANRIQAAVVAKQRSWI